MPVRTEVLRNSEAFKKLRFTDIGVFNGDRLVGWLNEEEAKGCNYIRGAVKRTPRMRPGRYRALIYGS